MNEEDTSQAANIREQAEAVCGRCGRPGATRFGDELICDDCYVACGSCCAEAEE
ncbi:MAG: hypothetical protein JNG86_04535 [Verrucomicrobiaceae bacterium]|nr:hypothetical protein [Verrucomicrobiaceae bacterium]